MRSWVVRVGAIAAVFTTGAGCQTCVGIDGALQLADAGFDGPNDAPALDGAPADAAPPLDCDGGVCVLYDDDPGPNFVTLVGDTLVFSMQTYANPAVPAEIWSMPKTGGKPTRIADDVLTQDMADDGDHVVILETTRIVRMRPDGSDRTNQQPSNGVTYVGLAVKDGWIYWNTHGVGVQRVHGDGGPAVVLVSSGGLASTAILATADTLYFGNKPDGAAAVANAMTFDGGAVTTLGELGDSQMQRAGFALGDDLYFSIQLGAAGVWRYADGGFAKVTSPPLLTPGRLMWRAPHLYVTDFGNFGQALGALWRYTPSQETWTKLASITYPRGTAIDDDYVYVVESLGPDGGVGGRHRRLLRVPR